MKKTLALKCEMNSLTFKVLFTNQCETKKNNNICVAVYNKKETNEHYAIKPDTEKSSL